MDGREYGPGFSNWGSGGSSNAGSAPYDPYAYDTEPDGYAGQPKTGPPGGYGGPSKGAPSGGSGPSSSGNSNADAVIAKINQRLDMLTQAEGGAAEGQGERFDQYESFDSGSSAHDPRGLYRSGNYAYGDSRGGMMAQRGGMGYGAMGSAGGGGGYDGSASFGFPKMRQGREPFSGSGWDAGHWSPYRGGRPGGGRGFGHRPDSSMLGGGGRSGGQGHFPLGRGKPPSLFSHHMFPDNRGFQPPPSPQFGNRRSTRQRFRKRPFKRIRDGLKKRKLAQAQADEPESKVGRTESAEDDGKKETSEEKKEDGTLDTESTSEAKGQTAGTKDETAKPKAPEKPPPNPKYKTKRGFESRTKLTFSCSICKFRSFYSEDMEAHLESSFHKDHFKFLSYQLTKPTAEFLQEYTKDKFKRTEQRVSELENHSATICQILKDQDQTKGIAMENFVRKVEAAHCSACNMYIPMQPAHISKHLKSAGHRYKRKVMMDQSKMFGLSVARNILDNDSISKKLERYLKGENPFTGNKVDENQEDSMVTETPEGEGAGKTEEKLGEGLVEVKVEPADDTGDTGGGGAPETMGNGEEEEEVKYEEEGEELAEFEEEGEELAEFEKEGEEHEEMMIEGGEGLKPDPDQDEEPYAHDKDAEALDVSEDVKQEATGQSEDPAE